MSDLNVYVFLDTKRCGWCRKFEPVVKSNVRAMAPRHQSKFQIVDLTTDAGRAQAQQLGHSGGIPNVIATSGDQQVYQEAGYKDGNKFANVLFNLFSMYG